MPGGDDDVTFAEMELAVARDALATAQRALDAAKTKKDNAYKEYWQVSRLRSAAWRAYREAKFEAEAIDQMSNMFKVSANVPWMMSLATALPVEVSVAPPTIATVRAARAAMTMVMMRISEAMAVEEAAVAAKEATKEAARAKVSCTRATHDIIDRADNETTDELNEARRELDEMQQVFDEARSEVFCLTAAVVAAREAREAAREAALTTATANPCALDHALREIFSLVQESAESGTTTENVVLLVAKLVKKAHEVTRVEGDGEASSNEDNSAHISVSDARAELSEAEQQHALAESAVRAATDDSGRCVEAAEQAQRNLNAARANQAEKTDALNILLETLPSAVTEQNSLWKEILKANEASEAAMEDVSTAEVVCKAAVEEKKAAEGQIRASGIMLTQACETLETKRMALDEALHHAAEHAASGAPALARSKAKELSRIFNDIESAMRESAATGATTNDVVTGVLDLVNGVCRPPSLCVLE